MQDINIDYKSLLKYQQQVQKSHEKAEEKNKKAFLRKEGSKLLRATKTAVRKSGMKYYGHVKNGQYAKAEHYYNSINRGKPYKYNGALAIRVFSNAPHAHLLEYGHEPSGWAKNCRRPRAFKPFETSRKRMEMIYQNDVDKWQNDVYEPIS